MVIHSVKDGDTVFTLARKYRVSPLKIIENNGLENPDALSVGEELLILSPTRTYTVRGGDTVERICRMFGIKKSRLQAANPALLGTDRLYPGELLAIRYDAPPYGMAVVNGYVYESTTQEQLCGALPYLTYATLSVGVTDGQSVRFLFNDQPYLKQIHDRGKIALMRVCEGDGMPLSPDDREGWEQLCDRLCTAAKAHGYQGITLAFYRTAKLSPHLYDDFVVRMRRRLLGCDLILFTETDANEPLALGDYADGNVLMYDKCTVKDPPSFEEGERAIAERYASDYESSRMFMDISPFGYDEDTAMTLPMIRQLAHKTRCAIKKDVRTGLCSLQYPKFTGGVREERTVVFESLENIKAKLHLVDAFGYMGVSLDVGRTPVSVFLMVHTLFCDADYSTLGIEERV